MSPALNHSRQRAWPAVIAALLLPCASLAAGRVPTTWQVRYSPDFSIGPDGPWNVLNQSIDFPDQFVLMYPSLAQTSAIVPSTACQQSNASCPVPLPGLWAGSAAQSIFKNNDSAPFDAATWDPISEPLGLRGQGHYISERITLKPQQSNGDTAFLDSMAVAVAESFAISFPGGARYTSTVGFFSLFGGGTDSITYKNRTGASVTLNRTMPAAFQQSWIPSMSYGLHIGSAAYRVPGTLYISAYDSARVLSTPILASSDNRFALKRLSFNVTSGGSAFTNVPNTPSGLAGAAQNVDLSVKVEPGVPYMYLPQAVCDGLAKHLPVTYNRDYNLYIWNSNQDAYNAIISSPHYLSFTFSDASPSASPSANNTSINVPLALLSLNLSAPISTTVTPYFPCRPYAPADGKTYILGRAFLQSAFVAQHWQAKRLWLAQAPGPFIPPGNIVNFDKADGTIAEPVGNQVSWDNTWSTVLNPLAASIDGNSGSGEGSGMQTSTKIGIGVGVVGGVLAIAAVVAVLLWRRKKRRARVTEAQPLHTEGVMPHDVYAKVVPVAYTDTPGEQKQKFSPPPTELHANERAEMYAGPPQPIAELPGEGQLPPRQDGAARA